MLKIIRIPVCFLAHHIFGENYTQVHRSSIGLIVAVCGVMLAKSGHHFPSYGIDVILDTTGYSIHAFGLYPLLENTVKFLTNTNKPS